MICGLLICAMDVVSLLVFRDTVMFPLTCLGLSLSDRLCRVTSSLPLSIVTRHIEGVGMWIR